MTRAMRSLLVFVGLATFVVAGPAYAAGNAKSSGAVSTDTVVTSRAAWVHSVTLVCPAAPCEVALFNEDAVGDIGSAHWEGRVAVNNDTGHFVFDAPLRMQKGLTVSVSGGGTGFIGYQ